MVAVSTARSMSGKNAASVLATVSAGGLRGHGRGLPEGALEAPGHVGTKPLAGGGEAGEGDRADRLADRRDHVADLVVLELLRGRALLVDVGPLALAERAIHLTSRDVERVDLAVVQAALVAGVLEHRQRLAAVV